VIKSFDGLLEGVRSAHSKRVAVAGAAQIPALEALKMASAQNLIEPVMVGPEGKLRDLADQIGFDLGAFRVVDEPAGDEACSAKAVAEVVAGRADLLMKGSVSTAKLLKAVLDKERGLRCGRILSHVAVVEVAGYPKLMLHTDGAINIEQDLAKRRDILANAVELARCLGIAKPFAAGLALVEHPEPKLPESFDMQALAREAAGGELGEIVFEGPIALDMALSGRIAQLKGVESRVAGRADIFLGPDITTVNFVVKSLIQLAGAKAAGLIVGARVPIVLLSRGDSPEIRMLGLALGAYFDEQAGPRGPRSG